MSFDAIFTKQSPLGFIQIAQDRATKFERTVALIAKIASCIPGIGLLVGVCYIAAACRSSDKAMSIGHSIRAVFAIVGLGILPFAIDILVTTCFDRGPSTHLENFLDKHSIKNRELFKNLISSSMWLPGFEDVLEKTTFLIKDSKFSDTEIVVTIKALLNIEESKREKIFKRLVLLRGAIDRLQEVNPSLIIKALDAIPADKWNESVEHLKSSYKDLSAKLLSELFLIPLEDIPHLYQSAIELQLDHPFYGVKLLSCLSFKDRAKAIDIYKQLVEGVEDLAARRMILETVTSIPHLIKGDLKELNGIFKALIEKSLMYSQVLLLYICTSSIEKRGSFKAVIQGSSLQTTLSNLLMQLGFNKFYINQLAVGLKLDNHLSERVNLAIHVLGDNKYKSSADPEFEEAIKCCRAELNDRLFGIKDPDSLINVEEFFRNYYFYVLDSKTQIPELDGDSSKYQLWSITELLRRFSFPIYARLNQCIFYNSEDIQKKCDEFFEKKRDELIINGGFKNHACLYHIERKESKIYFKIYDSAGFFSRNGQSGTVIYSNLTESNINKEFLQQLLQLDKKNAPMQKVQNFFENYFKDSTYSFQAVKKQNHGSCSYKTISKFLHAEMGKEFYRFKVQLTEKYVNSMSAIPLQRVPMRRKEFDRMRKEGLEVLSKRQKKLSDLFN